MFDIINRSTTQGQETRSLLLSVLQQQDGLTRQEIVEAAGLTYEQVRRQTHNLVIDGDLTSYLDKKQRRYFLNQKFTQTL